MHTHTYYMCVFYIKSWLHSALQYPKPSTFFCSKPPTKIPNYFVKSHSCWINHIPMFVGERIFQNPLSLVIPWIITISHYNHYESPWNHHESAWSYHSNHHEITTEIPPLGLATAAGICQSTRSPVKVILAQSKGDLQVIYCNGDLIWF